VIALGGGRLVQGAGGGVANVAAFALVMEVAEGSPGTLTRDMGIQEVGEARQGIANAREGEARRWMVGILNEILFSSTN